MKIVKTAGNKQVLHITREDWEKIGAEKGWLSAEAKKKKSPKQHGFIDQCIKENKDKDEPGAYCASIVDKVKGSTSWRKGPKKD